MAVKISYWWIYIVGLKNRMHKHCVNIESETRIASNKISYQHRALLNTPFN